MTIEVEMRWTGEEEGLSDQKEFVERLTRAGAKLMDFTKVSHNICQSHPFITA